MDYIFGNHQKCDDEWKDTVDIHNAKGGFMKEAMLYDAEADATVHCNLCNHGCRISEGKRGICRVRENREGVLYSLVYSKIIGQNRTPEQIVERAKAAGCKTIAYTYTEPTIFYEFAYDTAVLAHREGLKNVFVSNGYMSADAAREIAPHLDAINIDLKAFTKKFYKEICGARLAPVLETIQRMKTLAVWVEVTTLIIPGLNDGEMELQEMARFVKSVGCEVPWHVTAFYPTYKLTDRPSTPAATLHRAREIGLAEGLRYVYEGNVPAEAGENTYCYGCGAVVIERSGLSFIHNRLQDGKCSQCGMPIDGVGL